MDVKLNCASDNRDWRVNMWAEQCDTEPNKWSDWVLTAWPTVSLLRKTQLHGVKYIKV